MHPALLVEEILRVIFAHRYAQNRQSWDSPLAGFVSLARTYRAFKDPALDLLWMELSNLSPLVRCLPGVCRAEDLDYGGRMYMLERDLEPAEVDTLRLQAYTSRIRSLNLLLTRGVAQVSPDTITHLCGALQTEPLFPNLRQIYLTITNDRLILLPHIAVQNLRRLTLLFSGSDPSSCEDFMRSLSATCPGMQDISVNLSGREHSTTFSNNMILNIRRWTHLQSMTCPNVIMDIDTFFHLSRLPSLTRLSFTLDSALIGRIETSNHVFVLPMLQDMTLYNTSIVSDSKFLTHMRLPALRHISMHHHHPTSHRDVIRSFEMALKTVCNHKLIEKITLHGPASFDPLIAEPTTLLLEDLLPFAACNLTHLDIGLDWIVDMKDDDLLRLASDCPQITSLFINFDFGWRSAGITPVGLLKVLRLRPALWNISVALDTRGYQNPPPHELGSESSIGGGLGDPLPSGYSWFIFLTDSVIEAESVPALAAFFANCMPPGATFAISSWASQTVQRLHDNWQVYQARWGDVDRMAKEMIMERSKQLRSRRREV